MSRPHLNQADPAWAKVKCGLSKTKSIRNCGCLMTDLAEALRGMGIDNEATPVTVQARAICRWLDGQSARPFVEGTAAAFPVIVGAANGLKVGERINRSEGARMWSTLQLALPRGRALMHVDETPDDGKDDPVHWVLANRIEAGRVHFSDPDGGLAGSLPLESLIGTGPGGKPYKVSGIRVVTKL